MSLQQYLYFWGNHKALGLQNGFDEADQKQPTMHVFDQPFENYGAEKIDRQTDRRTDYVK